MKGMKGMNNIMLLVLVLGIFSTSAYSQEDTMTATVKIPKIDGDYVHVYKPAGDVFPGPDTVELKAGHYYEEWAPNDHTFVRDATGRWHAFGITHPLTSPQNVHDGECQAFHAVAPKGKLKDTLQEGSWQDQPKVLAPGDRPNELPLLYAPYIIHKDGMYQMIYSPQPLRLALSKDLYTWEPKGILPNAPVGRDPNLLFHEGCYYLTVCGYHQVEVATTADLKTWKTHPPILKMDQVDPESPSLIHYNNTFYLFVCGWDGNWDQQDVQGAYQHVTYVYQSNDPLHFTSDNLITTLDAHAPEVFQDEEDDWYISSAEWPHRGVSIAPISWK